MSDASNTGRKQATQGIVEAGRATRFVKGDPRINRKGRPRSFDQVRELAQSICHEELETKTGDKITVVDAILRQWAKSKEAALQKAFIEYAFGKVPDKIEGVKFPQQTLILHYGHEREPEQRTNGQRVSPALPSGAN